MGSKLAKSSFPAGHSAEDFQCFGPPALQDGDFDNCKIADMGSFSQEEKDSVWKRIRAEGTATRFQRQAKENKPA